MPFLTSKILLTAAFTGVLFFQARSMAPVKDAPAALPPSSLARAVATQNPLLFDVSLAAQVDVNAPGADGQTPLLIATRQRDRELIARLLGLGASVDVADADGHTPLSFAAAEGDISLLQEFVARSLRPNAAAEDGRSALHQAIAAQKYEAAVILLPLSDNFAASPEAGWTLFALAVERGDLPIVKATLGRLPAPLEWSPEARRALTAAIAAEDLELTRLLLSKHPATPTAEGQTVPLLAQAIVDDDLETLRALLRAGADPNTVLPTPCDKGFVAKVSSNYLRSYIIGDEGVTLLMLAAGLGRADSLRVLLDAGADKNRATPKFKMLALYFAARTQKPKCVQMLLGKGPSREELRVEISLAAQRASVIKDGVSILQTPVSTGRKGFDTRPGEYVITDKKRSHRSSIYHSEMPFFMRLNCLDFGLHAGNVPNYPASHGCIRLPAEFAQKLFSEIPVGTMVTIN